MSLLRLEPSRELDAKVAEVMGWKITSRDWPQGPELECGCLEAALSLAKEDIHPWHTQRGPVYYVENGEPGGEFPNPVPLFSEDAGSAFQEPWEWLKRKYRLGFCLETCNEHYQIVFHEPPILDDREESDEDDWQSSAALAICAAVLKAGQEVPCN